MAVQILNDTALALAFIMGGRIQGPSPQLTIVVKGAFELLPTGETAPRERTLLSGDVFEEDGSTLRYPSDFAPFKPRADVLLVATPPSNDGAGNTPSQVRLGLGQLEKALDATRVADFGPVDRRAEERIQRMGTFGPEWLKTRWPDVPEDFDWSYYNAAPTDQQLEALEGDEGWFVEGLHPDAQRYASRLPGARPRCLLRRDDENIEEVTLALDTVTIDVDESELSLVWRGVVDVATRDYDEIRQALLVCEALAEAPAPAERYHDPVCWRAPVASEEELAEADEAAARDAAYEPPEPPADDPEPDEEEAAEVASWIDELREMESDPALLDRLTGVTTRTAFLAITTAHLEQLANDAEAHAPDDEASEAGDDLERLKRELATAEIDPELRTRASKETTTFGFVSVLLSGLPDPRSEDDRRERDDAIAHLRRAGEDEATAARAAAAAPRAARGERLTREEVIALVQMGASLAEANLTELDLSDMSLEGVDLAGAKLDGARLERTCLTGARLVGASIRGAQLAGATLDDAVAEWARFDASVLRGADLSRASLGGCALAEADLGGATLEDADLTGADLRLAELGDARMRGAALDGATLSGTTLAGADAAHASLRQAALTDVDLSGANLDGASLIGCEIAGTNLSGASLRNTFLDDARIARSSFAGAALDGLRASNAHFDDCRFVGVRATRSHWPGAELAGADFAEALLHKSDFSGANLTGASFAGARLEAANLSRAKLGGAKLTQANLFQARLGGADLSGADCRASNLFASDLFDAILEGTRFEKANLGRTCVAARRGT